MKKRVFITGSSGFIGGYLLNTIEYAKAVAFDRNNITSNSWDGIEGIVHCAGLAAESRNQNLKELYFQSNVELTKEILEFFQSSNAKFFIFLSTSKIYECANTTSESTKDELGTNLSIYARSKLEAEKILLQVVDKKIFILRPSVVVGPNLKNNIKYLQILTRLQIPIILPRNTVQQNLTDIRNLSIVINYLVNNHEFIDSGIFNVLDNKNPTFEQLLLKSTKEKKPVIIRISNKYFMYFLKILKFFNPQLSIKLNKLLFQYTPISNDKICKLVDLPYNSFE